MTYILVVKKNLVYLKYSMCKELIYLLTSNELLFSYQKYSIF